MADVSGIRLALSSVSLNAVAGDAEVAEFGRPKYKFLRQNEDWSDLCGRDRKTTGDFFDPIKFIPLNEDESVWLSLGGHLRFRVEDWHDFGFAPRNDDTYHLARVLLHADLHIGDHLRIFAEGKIAFTPDRDLSGSQRLIDHDEGDLQQGFFDLKLPLAEGNSVTFRAGCQAFLFGKQRLVSPLPWANNLRSWDALTGILKLGDWTVTGFWSQFDRVRKYDFNEPDGQQQFHGIYTTGKIPGAALGWDLYWLGLDRDAVAVGKGFNGTMGNENRQTTGSRVWGAIGPTDFDFDIEGTLQFGEVGSEEIHAYMFASELGYKFKDVWSSPRLWLGFDMASGDDATGGGVETFNQLFPLGHAYNGYIDVVARQNLIDISHGISFNPFKKLTAIAAIHYFFRQDEADALYDAGGGVVRAGASAGPSSLELGHEIDLLCSNTKLMLISRPWRAIAISLRTISSASVTCAPRRSSSNGSASKSSSRNPITSNDSPRA